MSERKAYMIAGVVVNATLSEGKGFYDVTVCSTGEKTRWLAPVFEMIAVRIKDEDQGNEGTSQKEVAG